MVIMGCRLLGLQHIIDGYIKTGVPLIGFDGSNIVPFLVGDDIGMYVFVPQIVRLFSLTLQQALNLFFYSIMGGSFALAFIGFFLLYTTLATRVTAFTGLSFLLYFVLKFHIQDVYLAYLAGSLTTIPLFLYFLTKKRESLGFYYFMIASGSAASALHYIRAHSALGALLFMVTLILTQQFISYKKKMLLLGCLALGLALPIAYFKSVIHTYETYAHKEIHNFNEFPTRHPFWHTIYLGFSFLNYSNEDNIRYDDEFAYARAQKLAPDISHTKDFDAYEKILKNETFSLWKKQPYFFVYTVFAKIGILFLFFLLFANLGLFTRFFWPQPWNLELAFLIGLGCYALFPLIALPDFTYCTGFITLSTLYGITSINNFMMKYNFFSTLLNFVSKNKITVPQ